ncbi:hypothetical protein K438DRAFT_1759268 [Mycena galopus ATCC 62051]|nr:hypothetical protein K438DRAFT_1759268 [Mycena galopus ATCC 62051]
MFSFSKVLAFGLVSLSSVRAVPFMQTSCTVDFGTSVGPAHAFNVLDPSVYRIVNVATNTPVAASVQNGQIYVTIEGQQPGALAEWKLEKADQGGFKITNMALGTSIFSANESLLFCGWVTPAETFAVEPAGSGEFILTYSFKIKEVAADKEWTLAPVLGSPFGTALPKPRTEGTIVAPYFFKLKKGPSWKDESLEMSCLPSLLFFTMVFARPPFK